MRETSGCGYTEKNAAGTAQDAGQPKQCSSRCSSAQVPVQSKKRWRYLRHTLDNQKADRANDPQHDIEPHLIDMCDLCWYLVAPRGTEPADEGGAAPDLTARQHFFEFSIHWQRPSIDFQFQSTAEHVQLAALNTLLHCTDQASASHISISISVQYLIS